MLRNLRKTLAVGAVAAAALGTLVASTAPVSARVVCDRWGRCWHTHRPYYGAYYGGYYDDPYYYGGYYGPYYGPGPYYYGPPYGYYDYGPSFYGPSIGFGFTFGGGHHRR